MSRPTKRTHAGVAPIGLRVVCGRPGGQTFDALANLRRRRDAIFRRLREHLADELLEQRRNLLVMPRRRHRRRVDVLRDHRHDVVTEERGPSGEHLVKDAPERVDVGARVGLASGGLLRRHVRDRPDHHPFAREP